MLGTGNAETNNLWSLPSGSSHSSPGEKNVEMFPVEDPACGVSD